MYFIQYQYRANQSSTYLAVAILNLFKMYSPAQLPQQMTSKMKIFFDCQHNEQNFFSIKLPIICAHDYTAFIFMNLCFFLEPNKLRIAEPLYSTTARIALSSIWFYSFIECCVNPIKRVFRACSELICCFNLK